MKHSINILLIGTLFLFNTACKNRSEVQVALYPFSDSCNTGVWVLNEDISDEFEASQLDTVKWQIKGPNRVRQSNWIGRAPSQFSSENVRIEDGKLKLTTRWEPDFPFSDSMDKYPDGKEYAYENITTAAVISNKRFLYGYMEIKCKAADASITSSFWMTGHRSELDVFEFVGSPSVPGKQELEKEQKINVIDWRKTIGTDRSWNVKPHHAWRTADDFHVYGCEWDENYLKFYADGKNIESATKEEIGEHWNLKHPFYVWVDSETFPWVGIPAEEDLPVDYEIEYIRIWQKTGTEVL